MDPKENRLFRLALIFLILLSAVGYGFADFEGLRVTEIGSKTRLILEFTDAPPGHNLSELKDPFRVVINLTSKVLSKEQIVREFPTGMIKQIRFLTLKNKATEQTGLVSMQAVIVVLNQEAKYESFEKDKRIFVDLMEGPSDGFNSGESPSSSAEAKVGDLSIEETLANARDNYENGYYLLAKADCESVLKVDPDNSKAKRLIRKVRKKRNEQKAEASSLANEIASQEESSLSDQKSSAAELARSLATEMEETKANDKKFDGLVAAGKKMYRKRRWEEALSYWEEALTIKSGNEKVENLLAKAQRKINEERRTQNLTEPDLSQEDFDKVADLLEKGKESYSNLEYGNSIQFFENVIAIDPANLEARRYLAQARRKQKDYIDEGGDPDDVIMTPRTNIDDLGVLTVEECVEIGVANHLPTKISQEEVNLARNKVKDARRALYPKVKLKYKTTSGTTTGEDFEGEEWMAEIQHPLYSGGKQRLIYNQSRVNLAVSRKNYEKTKAEFVFEVRQAYYNLGFALAKLRNKKELEVKSKSLLDIAEKQYAAKGMTLAEILDARSQYQEVLFQVTEVQNDLDIARMALLQLLSLPLETKIDVVEIPDPIEFNMDSKHLIEVAYKNRRDYQVKKLMVLFRKYGLDVAKNKRKFQVELNANIGMHDEYFISEQVDLQQEYYIGIKVSKAIGRHVGEYNALTQDKVPQVGQTTPTEFNSHELALKLWEGKTLTEVADASIDYHKAVKDLENAKRQLVHDVMSSIYSAKEAQSKIKNKEASVAVATEELRSTTAKQKLDQATLIQVMRAEAKQWNSKSDLISARADYYIAIGRLNKHLGINDYFNPALGVVAMDKENESRGIRLLIREKQKKRSWYQLMPLTQGVPSYYPDEVVTDILKEKQKKEVFGGKKFWPTNWFRKHEDSDQFDEYKVYDEKFDFTTPQSEKKKKWYHFGKKNVDDDFSKYYVDQKEYDEAFDEGKKKEKKGLFGWLGKKDRDVEESYVEPKKKSYKKWKKEEVEEKDEFEAFLKDKSRNIFAEFHIEDNRDETILAVRANSKVKYTTAILNNPARVVVTFKDKIISALPDFDEVNKGAITSIKALHLPATLPSMYKGWKELKSLIIELDDEHKFSVKSKGKIFKVKVIKS